MLRPALAARLAHTRYADILYINTIATLSCAGNIFIIFIYKLPLKRDTGASVENK